jgi:hypothetical protein
MGNLSVVETNVLQDTMGCRDIRTMDFAPATS